MILIYYDHLIQLFKLWKARRYSVFDKKKIFIIFFLFHKLKIKFYENIFNSI